MLALFKYIRGSQCHGISTPQSDTDMGGVFLCDNQTLLEPSLSHYKDEESDERHDVVMWELNKYARLLMKSNPSVLESLFVDDEFITHLNPEFRIFLRHRDQFLTKACFDPFGHYAAAQIRKARGLNKMIVKPILERRGPVDFCYVIDGNDTISMQDWLKKYGRTENDISLAKLNHFRDTYAIFLHPGGICREGANSVHCRDIPKGMQAVAFMCFNKDAYTTHCRDYKNQKEWEAHRNPVRYEANLNKNYDAKNLCECIRLVRTCTEIANGEGYKVNRAGIDGDFLLSIKRHEYEYDELMDIALKDIEKMEKACAESNLPDSIDPNFVDYLVMTIRRRIGNL